jgi:hypothetical protein
MSGPLRRTGKSPSPNREAGAGCTHPFLSMERFPMRKLLSLTVAIAILSVAGLASAAKVAKVESGLKQGETIGPFYVTKFAGNKNDGVEDGETLCYRCKLGAKPVVAVFARSVDKNLAKLIGEVDKVVAKNQDKKLASFVNLVGDDNEQLKKDAQKLVKKSHAKHVAVLAPAEGRKGWDKLKLNDKVDLTILIYKDGMIVANHAFAAGKLDKSAIASVIADTDKILN